MLYLTTSMNLLSGEFVLGTVLVRQHAQEQLRTLTGLAPDPTLPLSLPCVRYPASLCTFCRPLFSNSKHCALTKFRPSHNLTIEFSLPAQGLGRPTQRTCILTARNVSNPHHKYTSPHIYYLVCIIFLASVPHFQIKPPED